MMDADQPPVRRPTKETNTMTETIKRTEAEKRAYRIARKYHSTSTQEIVQRHAADALGTPDDVKEAEEELAARYQQHLAIPQSILAWDDLLTSKVLDIIDPDGEPGTLPTIDHDYTGRGDAIEPYSPIVPAFEVIAEGTFDPETDEVTFDHLLDTFEEDLDAAVAEHEIEGLADEYPDAPRIVNPEDEAWDEQGPCKAECHGAIHVTGCGNADPLDRLLTPAIERWIVWSVGSRRSATHDTFEDAVADHAQRRPHGVWHIAPVYASQA